MQDVPFSERLHLPAPTIDTAATQKLLDYFAEFIEDKGEWSKCSTLNKGLLITVRLLKSQ